MKRIASAVLVLLAALGPASAGCGVEMNCQIAAVSIDERQAWLEKLEQSKRRSAAYVARAYAAYLEKNPPIALAKAEGNLAPTDYLHDPTLRKNDIVVTDEGVLVYKGGSGGVRSFRDFIFLRQVEAENALTGGLNRSRM